MAVQIRLNLVKIKRLMLWGIRLVGISTALAIRSLDLLDCACDAQTDRLGYEISAINGLFYIKNGRIYPKTCK